MNRFGAVLLAGLLAVSVTGCADEKKEEPVELTVQAEEGFDEDYSRVMKDYFSAIEKQDFAAYKAAIYPPFFEKLTEYNKQKDNKTMEQVFEGLHKQFDEDGYDSWTLTRVVATIYKNKQGVSSEQDALDFLDAYKSGGMVDEQFVEDTKKAAKDMQDVKFSVYALYTGDEEDVPVINAKELLVIKTEDGAYVFG
ncbi:MAG: hypothetical protein IK130_07640 [Oscillospiraceae bacterium]|nr:hypothetical protein [Oscillospiraceae bacterium]